MQNLHFEGRMGTISLLQSINPGDGETSQDMSEPIKEVNAVTNSTNNPPEYKTCLSLENCQHPDGPTLPLSEFYKRGEGKGFDSYCKKCKIARNQQYTAKNGAWRREKPGNNGELLVINKLRQLGIYAAPGKCSEWKWIDVIAWGCVRIDVKTASETIDGSFLFGLGSNKRRNLKNTDLFVLICHWQDGVDTYHVFYATDPVFKTANNNIKNGIQYLPAAKWRHSRSHLTPEKMSDNENNWQLIEVIRQRKIAAIIEAA